VRTSVDVHNYLVERDIPHELVSTEGRVRAPERMAAVLDLPPQQVGRVVVLEASRRPVAVLVPADLEPSLGRVARAVPTPTLTEPAPDRVTDITEFLAEAMPPVALPDGTMIIVDRALAEQEILYFPGGETQSMLKIRSADLIRATGAKVARLTR
jgi:prolyl-tRNA editing enzyme YbaK/EbsC (Cys-tRNA(Pro) deacylase)